MKGSHDPGRSKTMKLPFQRDSAGERGYILLALLLMVALLSLGLLAEVQNIELQIRRDREEEMIHRGTQYSRAVRLFFVKFKRYPANIQELENTNNIRFLRKRYKDPITGKDFKPLYMTDVAIFTQNKAPVQPPAAIQVQESNAAANHGAEGAGEAACTPVPDGQNPADLDLDTPPCPPSTAGSNGAGGAAAASEPDANDPEGSGAPPLNGVPIVGVVSYSKEKTIREFDNKDHYNQWLFIFNPSGGTTGLINTPDQPNLLQRAQHREQQNQNPSQDPGSNQPNQPNQP